MFYKADVAVVLGHTWSLGESDQLPLMRADEELMSLIRLSRSVNLMAPHSRGNDFLGK